MVIELGGAAFRNVDLTCVLNFQVKIGAIDTSYLSGDRDGRVDDVVGVGNLVNLFLQCDPVYFAVRLAALLVDH